MQFIMEAAVISFFGISLSIILIAVVEFLWNKRGE